MYLAMKILCLNVQAGSMDRLQMQRTNMLPTIRSMEPLDTIPKVVVLLLTTAAPSLVMSSVVDRAISPMPQVNGTGRLVMLVETV